MNQILLPKERVLKALNFQAPDRVPVFITITPQVAEQLSRHLGVKNYTQADSPLSENRISFTELLTALGNDVVGIGACAPKARPTREIEPGILVDEWQIKYRKIGYYAEMVEHPLAQAETAADILSFDFPDPLAEGRFTLAEQMVERYGERYAICGDLECTVFEGSWHLTGFEKLIVDLTLNKDYVFVLMDRIMEYSLGTGRELIKRGADIIWLGDDMGTQTGMLISPEMWRKVFKKRLHLVIRELKAINRSLKIAYHSCGSYYPIIPDLLEIGVDILNALQPQARGMDLQHLKKTYGDKACFFGGVDIQRVLPFGTLEDIEREVKRVLAAAGQDGGYILAGAHNIQPDTSGKKVIALFDFARKHGLYPNRKAL
ncbi:MAG: uroporphyrinogen decarboxylase family protein [Spirochaetota bacterium]